MQIITVIGEVIHGAKRGRMMGFPTANIIMTDKEEHLVNGVYAASVELLGEHHPAVANIGTHPTVGDSPEKLLEVNIFDFDKDIYGETISVTLSYFIRPEQKFKDMNELKEQIAKDCSYVRSLDL